MRKTAAFLLAAALSLFCIVTAHAADVSGPDIIHEVSGIPNQAMLYDMDLESAQDCAPNADIALEQPEGIAALYLVFDREYGSITLTAPDGGECILETGGMLHYFIDVEACFGRMPEALILCFSDGPAALNELRVFGAGAIPDWVQRWDRIPDGEADLLLFSTHGDDEQLFFAGLLPWYGAEKGYRVQVAYFTDHRNMTTHRVHEMLNGLWAVGIRDYPVFGSFADYYTFDLQDAYRFYQNAGQPEETLLGFVVEQLRRYHPLVAVGHDIHGEYGHGMHQLYTDLLRKAVEVSADPEQFPELADQYGVWDVPKTYLHLYPENGITMDWDIPLESFDGKTAYEVTRDYGFPSHLSQQKDFAWYFRGSNRAADIQKYSPCRYGLYRSTVGKDVEKNDFFENIASDAPDESLAPQESAAPDEPAQTLREPAAGLSAAERNWLIFPAVGAAVLTVLTTWLNAPASGEKF